MLRILFSGHSDEFGFFGVLSLEADYVFIDVLGLYFEKSQIK